MPDDERATDEMTIDELARRAGTTTSTVRMYQHRRLLDPPAKRGRVGVYGDQHLARLRLIGQLQDDGHSLAGIADLLAQWAAGHSLDAMVGLERGLDGLLGDAHAVELEAVDLAERFPAEVLSPELMQRAVALGLVEITEAGRVRVVDRRFVEAGSSLARMGVPLDVVLDEWEALVAHTDDIAGRFVDVFDAHVAPAGWRSELDDSAIHELAARLVELRSVAHQVMAAALDASLAHRTRVQLGELVEGQA